MSKVVLILGAILIISSVAVTRDSAENVTTVVKGIHESDLSIPRDPGTGLPLVNPLKGASAEDAAPRGDRL